MKYEYLKNVEDQTDIIIIINGIFPQIKHASTFGLNKYFIINLSTFHLIRFDKDSNKAMKFLIGTGLN